MYTGKILLNIQTRCWRTQNSPPPPSKFLDLRRLFILRRRWTFLDLAADGYVWSWGHCDCSGGSVRFADQRSTLASFLVQEATAAARASTTAPQAATAASMKDTEKYFPTYESVYKIS